MVDNIIENRRVFTNTKNLTIWNIRDMVDENDLILNPEYQREYVYDNVKASRLVESVLLDIPIPSVYLSEEEDGSYSTIDGQQRITSLVRFTKNEFALSKLGILSELNGVRFKDLPKAYQRKFKTSTLEAICINKESGASKFEIFARLNQGAVSLNAQELRNCVYRGPFNDLLDELATHPLTKELFGVDNKRKKYQETILRFFAIRNLDTYKSSMLKHLNMFMSAYQNATPEQIEIFKELYINTMSAIKYVLGTDAFSLNSDKSEKMSITVFDSIVVPFSSYDKHTLIKNADNIRININMVKQQNSLYVNSPKANTAAKNNILYRVSVINNAILSAVNLKDILGNKRFFSREEKELLFKTNPVCGLCGNVILDINDSEVDHVVPYDHGGPTELSNAQLLHRSCNRKKSNKNMNDSDLIDMYYERISL